MLLCFSRWVCYNSVRFDFSGKNSTPQGQEFRKKGKDRKTIAWPVNGRGGLWASQPQPSLCRTPGLLTVKMLNPDGRQQWWAVDAPFAPAAGGSPGMLSGLRGRGDQRKKLLPWLKRRQVTSNQLILQQQGRSRL